MSDGSLAGLRLISFKHETSFKQIYHKTLYSTIAKSAENNSYHQYFNVTSYPTMNLSNTQNLEDPFLHF